MLKRNLSEILSKTLHLVIELAKADFGNIQIVDPEGHLRIFVHQGFPDWWIEYWNTVSVGQGSCGTSIALGERVIVEDVAQSPIFVGTPALEIQLKAGVRAVQSTPVLNQSGQIIAMLSTHWRLPHRPDAKTLEMLDHLTVLLAAFIEQTTTETPLLPENRYRAIIQDLTEVICRVLPDGTFSFVNEVFCKLFGKTSQQLIGQRWHPIAHDDDLPIIEAKLREMSPDNPVINMVNRNYVADGELRWMQWVNRGIYDTDGHLKEIQAVGRDITALKNVELELGISEERLEMALAGSGLVLWDWLITERKVIAGNRWFELLGYTNEELGNDEEDWLNLINPQDLERFNQKLAAHLQGETAIFESEHRLRHKAGYWVLVEARGKVIRREKDSTPLRMVGTLLDITQRKRLNDEASELLKRFESLINQSLSPSPGRTEKINLADNLTKRQRQIVGMIAAGMTSAEIGKYLNLSKGTVITHRRNLMATLDLHSAAEVTRFAIDHGLLNKK